MNASCLPLPSHPVLPDASSDFILREGKVLQARMNSRLGAGSWGCLSKESLLRRGSLPQARMKSRLRAGSLPQAGTDSRLRVGSLPWSVTDSRLGVGSLGCLSKESLLRWGSLPGSRMKSVLGGRTFPWSGTNLFSITGLLLSLRKALKTKDLSLPRPARRPAPPR